MRALIQRTLEKSYVVVENKIVGEIPKGLVILLGVGKEDTEEDLKYLSNKIPSLRIFEDSEGKTNLSLEEIGGEILLISQFTLYAEVSTSGRRPSFSHSAPPDLAKKLYENLITLWQQKDIKVTTGIFGANMKVHLINEGPFTLFIDSQNR